MKIVDILARTYLILLAISLGLAKTSFGSDTQPPRASIIAPTNGATLSGTFLVKATASDNIRVWRVQFFVDSALAATTYSTPYTFSLDTRRFANGKHSVSVRATDLSWNSTSSPPVNFTVKNVAPSPRPSPKPSASPSPSPKPSPCLALYPGQNNASDPNRFNIVLVGAGFETMDKYVSAARLLIDLDNTTRGFLPGVPNQASPASGLMQIPIYAQNKARFNFWYVNYNEPFASGATLPDGNTVWNLLSTSYNNDRILQCQQVLPNRVIPVFIYPTINNPGVSYPYASYGRTYVTVNDRYFDKRFIGSLQTTNPTWQYSGLVSDLHELQHTIPCLADEYGSAGTSGFWGSTPAPTPSPLFYPPVPFPTATAVSGNSSLTFWKGSRYISCVRQCTNPDGSTHDCWNYAQAGCGDPLAATQPDYLDCLIRAPWKDLIGTGCKASDGSSCWNSSITGCDPSRLGSNSGIDVYAKCCKPGTHCFAEIGCFQGGLGYGGGDLGIWRPSAGTIMRNPYFLGYAPDTNLNGVDQNLIQKMLNKGPAVGRHWSNLSPWGPNFQRDCDVTDAGFAEDSSP